MVLTPVCAHSIHAVPLVFSASRTLTVVAEETNRDSVYASADSHSRCDLQPGESLTITTAVEQLGLITFDETEQFRAIETKLMRR
jgi:probable inorganic polyphosphate/ATP-NAD kinase